VPGRIAAPGTTSVAELRAYHEFDPAIRAGLRTPGGVRRIRSEERQNSCVELGTDFGHTRLPKAHRKPGAKSPQDEVADLPSIWMPPPSQSTELQSKNYIFLQQTLRTTPACRRERPGRAGPKFSDPPVTAGGFAASGLWGMKPFGPLRRIFKLRTSKGRKMVKAKKGARGMLTVLQLLREGDSG